MIVSDVFFSIWLNNIPSQMNTELRPLSTSETGVLPFSSAYSFFEIHHTSSVLAIRILEHELRFNQSNTTITFSRHQNRRFPYTTKSPSLNDEFIFYTNFLPIDIEHIPFNISYEYERGTRKNLPPASSIEYFKNHTTSKAVDGYENTCWRPNRSVKIGDYFALDFLNIHTNIIFDLTVAHSYPLQNSLDMRISLDGLRWASYRSSEGIFMSNNNLDQSQYTMIFNSTQFTLGFKSFRYVMFNGTISLNESFDVCEVKLITANIK